MRSEMPSSSSNAQLDNELDIAGLFLMLLRGKHWIVAMAAIFALIALIYSFLVKQEWTATAITDRPTITLLGNDFSQQQFLRNLDVKNSPVSTSNTVPIEDDAYQEFIRQLSSYDTKRDFWLQSSYLAARVTGKRHHDAKLLDEMIANIQFITSDDNKKQPDQVSLVAETAGDANTLLRAYVTFANQRAAGLLTDNVGGAWAARTLAVKAEVQRAEAVADTVFQRDLSALRQALDIAKRQGIGHSQTDVPAESLPPSAWFLLGEPVLQARLMALQAAGPSFDAEYDQNRALLTTLNAGPVLQKNFQAYRYLRTPEEPIKRDSPRRVFLLILWGAMGALVGAGIALVRRRDVTVAR